MRNVKLIIRYDGTAYCGWQSQKNGASIQDTVQRAIKDVTGEKVCLTGSGRTDSGVHAEAQTANFKTRSGIPAKNLAKAINSRLPRDIVITGAGDAANSFDARKDAVSKLYRYTIINSAHPDPLLRHFAAKVFFRLNIDLMRKAARHIAGRHDFRSFKATDGERKNSVRTVKYVKIVKKGRMVYIWIEADGFLYNMVRNIVGTLVDVGRGRFKPEQVKDIIKARDIKFSGPTMPAKGLCMVRARYKALNKKGG